MFPWIAIESKFYQERFLESKPKPGICEIPMSGQSCEKEPLICVARNNIQNWPVVLDSLVAFS